MNKTRSKKGGGDLYRVIEELDVNGIIAARNAYAEEFDLAHNDPKIDSEIERLFWSFDPPDQPVSDVEVPVELLLAIILREGFGGRKSGPRPTHLRTVKKKRTMREARKRKKQLKSQGLTAKKAEDKIVEELNKRTPYSESEIRDGLTRRK